MKTPEYVAAAVTAARQSRDEGKVDKKTETLLRSVFSRSGFTDGYLTGKRTDMFGIRTETDKALSAAAESELHELYRHEFRRVEVDFTLILPNGQEARLQATDGERTVEVLGGIVSPAQNKPIDHDFAFRQLSRTGGTPFILRDLHLSADEDVFLPPAELNKMRRDALEALLTARQTISPCIFTEELEEFSDTEHVLTSLIARFTHTLPQNLDGISRAYLSWDADDALFARLLAEIGEVGVELPRVFFGSTNRLETRLLWCKEQGVTRALCESPASALIAQRMGFIVDGGIFSQVMNSASLASLEELGYASCVVSFENTLEQMRTLRGRIELGIVAYGYLPLMLVRCCPLKETRKCVDCKGDYLTDRKGKKFFVKCRDNATELFNCVPLYIGDRKRELKNVDFAMLYFTHETNDEIDAILSDWKNAAPPSYEHTRGLYYRGVL